MRLRRFGTGITVVCLALGFFFWQPGAARPEVTASGARDKEAAQGMSAENTYTAKAGGQQAAVSLEQAIKLAKEDFAVPEGFDRFETVFNQSDKKAFWELNWFSSGEPGGNMNIRVNAETGEIWGMHRWIPPAPGQEYRGLPKYTREQVESTALALAVKLQPERFKETRLQPNSDSDYLPLMYRERGPVEYRYNYARIINGVPYPENGINITVSGDTGEVTGFDLNWDDTRDLPPAAGCITQAQAEQVLRSEASPELYYFRPSLPGGKEVPLKLVYRLPGLQDQVIIDALTGKVLSKEGGFNKFYGMAGGGAGFSMADSRKIPTTLAPVEESAVEEARNLLPRDKALEMAKSAINVPGDYTLNSSRLEQDYMFKNNKIWHFNWQTGDELHRKWLDISVDAVSGVLVSFDLNLYANKFDFMKEPEVKFSEEDARKIAEDFVKKVQPGRWGQVVFKSSRPDPGLVAGPTEKPRPRSYNFNWVRLANGIQFPENGFYLTVNSTTGEVTGYRMTWWDVDFPATQGVIIKEAAADGYLQKAQLTLAYMRLWSPDKWIGPQEAKVQLVYSLAQRNFVMLDAFTGQPLNFQGEVVTTPGEKDRFEDLAGHPAREAVELLARTGIITGEGGKYRPDEPITQAELITMLVKSSEQRPAAEFRAAAGTGGDPWYRPYYNAAARIGIIQAGELPDPDTAVTREVLAQLTIHAMGYYKVARLSEIYALNFQDADEIPDYLRGHVALAAGLGLIEPVDGKFLPKAVVTRGEAAMSLVKMLNSGK